MRKLLKSTIGAMAVGLGMMMVVGCQNPNSTPIPTEKTYTVKYVTPFDDVKIKDSEVVAFNIEQAKAEALKDAPQTLELGTFSLLDKVKNPTEKSIDKSSLITLYGWDSKEDGNQITLTAKWCLSEDFKSYKRADSYQFESPKGFFHIFNNKNAEFDSAELTMRFSIQGYSFGVISELTQTEVKTPIPAGVELKIEKIN